MVDLDGKQTYFLLTPISPFVKVLKMVSVSNFVNETPLYKIVGLSKIPSILSNKKQVHNI
jgi:hypothetical protein